MASDTFLKALRDENILLAAKLNSTRKWAYEIADENIALSEQLATAKRETIEAFSKAIIQRCVDNGALTLRQALDAELARIREDR